MSLLIHRAHSALVGLLIHQAHSALVGLTNTPKRTPLPPKRTRTKALSALVYFAHQSALPPKRAATKAPSRQGALRFYVHQDALRFSDHQGALTPKRIPTKAHYNQSGPRFCVRTKAGCTSMYVTKAECASMYTTKAECASICHQGGVRFSVAHQGGVRFGAMVGKHTKAQSASVVWWVSTPRRTHTKAALLNKPTKAHSASVGPPRRSALWCITKPLSAFDSTPKRPSTKASSHQSGPALVYQGTLYQGALRFYVHQDALRFSDTTKAHSH